MDNPFLIPMHREGSLDAVFGLMADVTIRPTRPVRFLSWGWFVEHPQTSLGVAPVCFEWDGRG